MLYLLFESSKKDVDLWKSIFSYLEDLPASAHLQDLMSVFGGAADTKLENLINEFGIEEAFLVEFWNHDDVSFSVMIYSSSAEHEKEILELLSLCDITNLRYGEDADC